MTPLMLTNAAAVRDRMFYNLLPGERELLRDFQMNLDPVSGEPLSDFAHMDHDHRTGLIRGLLNPMTNKFLVDDVQRLLATLAYLKNPPAVACFGPIYGLLGKAQKKKKMRYGPDGSPEPHPRGPGALAMPRPHIEITDALGRAA